MDKDKLTTDELSALFFVVGVGIKHLGRHRTCDIASAAIAKISSSHRDPNQCMGCQASWPMTDGGAHVTYYPNGATEFVVCTKSRYEP